jgi:hypothetical protein
MLELPPRSPSRNAVDYRHRRSSRGPPIWSSAFGAGRRHASQDELDRTCDRPRRRGRHDGFDRNRGPPPRGHRECDSGGKSWRPRGRDRQARYGDPSHASEGGTRRARMEACDRSRGHRRCGCGTGRRRDTRATDLRFVAEMSRPEGMRETTRRRVHRGHASCSRRGNHRGLSCSMFERHAALPAYGSQRSTS